MPRHSGPECQPPPSTRSRRSLDTVSDDPFRTAVLPRPTVHSGRREFAGARVPRRRRHAALHRGRERRLDHRCRWPALHRLHRQLGTDDPRPPASEGAGRDHRAGADRRQLRRADRGRDRDGRAALRARARARAGAPVQLRHRGDDECAAPRARLHRARQDPEVRGLLPRPQRFAAGQGRLRRADLRRADLARRAGRLRAPHADRRLQRSRLGRGAVQGASGADRLRDRRARSRQHELHSAAARLPRRPAAPLPRRWRAADLR